MPSLTGKFELEYEGELMGAENLARELIRQAVGDAFSVSLGSADLREVVSFFEAGASLRLKDDARSDELLEQLGRVPTLLDHVAAVGVAPGDPPPVVAAAGEFILEGLYAQKKIGRTDDRGFVAPERRSDVDVDMERLERLRRMKKQVN
jgi:magnesium chelatase subunit I